MPYESDLKPEDIYNFCLLKGLILDIGCGYGNNMKYFEERNEVSKVIGIDIVIDILKNKSKRACADAHLIPFKSNIFDGVICSEILEHLPNPELCIKEIRRVLKKDGVAFISTPVLNIPMPILIPIFRKISGREKKNFVPFDRHLHVFSTKMLIDKVSKELNIIDVKYLGFTAILRLEMGSRIDKFLSNLNIPFLNYFASKIFIKAIKR